MLLLAELEQKQAMLQQYKDQYTNIKSFGDCDELEELDLMIIDLQDEIRLLKREIKRVLK